MTKVDYPPKHKSGFLCFVDITGRRHAVRLGAITALRDADDEQSETLIVINGREIVPTPYGIDGLLKEITAASRRR